MKKTKTYRVVWEIDIETTNPRQAAKKALKTLLNIKSVENIATIFKVEGKEIDLLNFRDKIVANENPAF